MKPICEYCCEIYISNKDRIKKCDTAGKTCCICFNETDDGMCVKIPKSVLQAYQLLYEDGMNRYGEPVNPPDGDF